MSKELVASMAAYIAAWIAPHVIDWGVSQEFAQECAAFAAAAVYFVTAAVTQMLSRVPKIYGPALIAVTLIEETIADRPNDEKKTLAVQKLNAMIDAMSIGSMQKWFLKKAAPSAIEAIVKQAKVLLATPPPAKAQ